MNKLKYQAARWISVLAHPFMMVALLAGVAGWRLFAGKAAMKVLLPVFIAVMVPITMLMIFQVRRGRWSNVDASNKSERPVLFIVALAGNAVLLVYFMLTDSPMHLIRGTLIVSAFLVLAALLVRWVKLSLHMAFASLAATALVLIGSSIGYVLIGVVPLLAWSRLALLRHRPHEIVLGLILGILTGVSLIYF